VVYKAGKINANANALSRNPISVFSIDLAKRYSKKTGDQSDEAYTKDG